MRKFTYVFRNVSTYLATYSRLALKIPSITKGADAHFWICARHVMCYLFRPYVLAKAYLKCVEYHSYTFYFIGLGFSREANLKQYAVSAGGPGACKNTGT